MPQNTVKPQKAHSTEKAAESPSTNKDEERERMPARAPARSWRVTINESTGVTKQKILETDDRGPYQRQHLASTWQKVQQKCSI